jgi:hypothetical protein
MNCIIKYDIKSKDEKISLKKDEVVTAISSLENEFVMIRNKDSILGLVPVESLLKFASEKEKLKIKSFDHGAQIYINENIVDFFAFGLTTNTLILKPGFTKVLIILLNNHTYLGSL